MRKTALIGSLFIAIIMFSMLSGVCTAQENPKTAPKDSWIYKDLGVLYHDGLLPNYPYNWVEFGNELLRVEIAYYIKRCISEDNNNQQKLDRSQGSLEALQRLVLEFRQELQYLGVQIASIHGLSPDLIDISNDSDEYQDLDSVFRKNKVKADQEEPFYYYGQYYKDLNPKSFVFIPDSYVKPAFASLLAGKPGVVNVIYQPKLGVNPAFLVIRGNLPVEKGNPLSGYYLFPLDDALLAKGKPDGTNFDTSLLTVLDEVNHVQKVDNLWRFGGYLSLDGYVHFENSTQTKPLYGNFDDGLKVGGLFLYKDRLFSSQSFDLNNFGRPTYSAPSNYTTAVDLDKINWKYLQSMEINVQGSVSLSPQTSLYGGVDLVYRNLNNGGFSSIWPSDTKTSAGLQYQLNGYWSLLTYQSLVNSKTKDSAVRTTSFGVDYSDWLTLWLSYQMIDFDKPVVTGTVSVRF